MDVLFVQDARLLQLAPQKCGARLIRSADPAAWNGVVIGFQLWRDDGATLEGCAQSAARTGKAHAAQ